MLINKKGNFKMKEIIWEHKAKVIWEHILCTFCFQNVKTEFWMGVARWSGAGLVGHDIFPSASQMGLNYFNDLYSGISSKFLSAGSLHDIPKGKSRSFLLKCPWAGEDDAHYLSLPRLPLRSLQGCPFSHWKICPSSWNLALLSHPSCLSSM